MLKRIYRYAGFFLEKRPWGIQLIYHSIRHYKLYEFMEALFVAFLFALVIRSFFFQAFKIPSESMVPTLLVGDRLFVNKMVYYFHPPEIGDVVVFKTPDVIHDPRKPIYIKRVVGGEEDTVSIRDVEVDSRGQPFGRLYVNGERAAHPVILRTHYYVAVGQVGSNGRVEEPKIYTSETVPPGDIYVFGDYSSSSLDSRYWGGVPESHVKGKAVLRGWPPNRCGLVE